MHTVIVSGGNLREEFVLSFLKEHPYEKLIAVDNGLSFLYRHGIPPTHIVGDFDTIDPQIVKWYREHTDIEIRAFDPIKDATDTQIAIELALELQSTSITVLGGMGTRLDHTLGNVQTMMLALKKGVECELLDELNRVRLIREPIVIKKAEQYGSYVSLLPLTTVVDGVNLIGFKYPLTDFTFTSTGSAGRGVSNEIVAEEGRIEFQSGIFVLIEAKDS